MPLLLALAAVTAATPLPAALVPYVHDGQLDPGDYRWMRGAFAGSSPAEMATMQTVRDWWKRCADADGAAITGELAALGVTRPLAPEAMPIRTPLCAQVAGSMSLATGDWATFQRDLAVVRPLAAAYLSATAAADVATRTDEPTVAQQTVNRLVRDQVLRAGLDWANGEKPESPKLTATQRAMLLSTMADATQANDHANTEWLKALVAKQGWPKRSQVGGPAAKVAWLLVQHADADPAFQLRALRLMEPLVPTGEVDRKNYAYLYDRVGLKITGRQRYATQMTCKAGRYVPEPLEDAAAVDARRREAGMQPLADYDKQLVEEAGPCPPDPPAPAP